MPGATVLDRSQTFDAPFVYVLMNAKAADYCAYCLCKPGQKTHDAEVVQLPQCAQCRFSRYCSKECQRLAWKDHKPECSRLQQSFPNLPLSEVMFLSRMLDKLEFIKEYGDIHKWEKYRSFDSLISHEDELRKDEKKMHHFEMVYAKLLKFRGEDESSRPKEPFFVNFCRTWINSHSIHTSAGHEIGIALDLGVSRYDHRCRPNCSLVFDGIRAVLRPLTPNVNADNPKKAFISYIDVGRSRYQRQKDLKSKWYFDCQCDRCLDPEDDILTSIKCATKGCDEPLIITELSEPMHIACPKCKRVTEPEHVQECQRLMLKLPSNFNLTDEPEQIKEIAALLEDAKRLLHAENIYYCRLQTAYFQMCGDDRALLNADMQKRVYQNYRRCFPEADRHIGYQLLHLVKGLIMEGRRPEATPYAYEAMTIFEVCFGLSHPYYLQTLALWTYLDNDDRRKSDAELVALMNFNYNKTVDIAPLLGPTEDLMAKMKHDIQTAQETELGEID